jgi:hypothetical protein
VPDPHCASRGLQPNAAHVLQQICSTWKSGNAERWRRLADRRIDTSRSALARIACGTRLTGDARRRQRQRPAVRRRPGELNMADFLSEVLDTVRRLCRRLRELQTRHQGPFVKLFADDSAIQYELLLHRNRGRADLGLHFETR